MNQLQIKSCTKCNRLVCTKRRWCPTCRRVNAEYQSRRWAHRACVHSRIADENAKRTYKQEDFITPERLIFLKKLQEDKCVYCETQMQTANRRLSDGLTIERINNKLAHTKHNTVLCCNRCNCVGGRGDAGFILQHCFPELLQRARALLVTA